MKYQVAQIRAKIFRAKHSFLGISSEIEKQMQWVIDLLKGVTGREIP